MLLYLLLAISIMVLNAQPFATVQARERARR